MYHKRPVYNNRNRKCNGDKCAKSIFEKKILSNNTKIELLWVQHTNSIIGYLQRRYTIGKPMPNATNKNNANFTSGPCTFGRRTWCIS